MNPVAETFDTKQLGHRPAGGRRMARGWPPDGRRVAAGWQVPVWGRCLAGWWGGGSAKEVRTPFASKVWGMIMMMKMMMMVVVMMMMMMMLLLLAMMMTMTV